MPPSDWTAERLDALPIGTVIQTHYRVVRADTWDFEVKDDAGHWIADGEDAATSAEVADRAAAITVYSLPIEDILNQSAAGMRMRGVVDAYDVARAMIEAVPGVTR